jgi:spore coat protein CotH
MKEWLHSAYSSIIFRSKFSSFELDDEIMQVTFTLTNSVDDNYDSDFVTSILAKGVILNYFPSKLENTANLAVMIGGKEEKKLLGNYNQNMERLHNLQTEFERELTRHSYHFGSYGES